MTTGKKTNLQNNINITFLILGSSENKQKIGC